MEVVWEEGMGAEECTARAQLQIGNTSISVTWAVEKAYWCMRTAVLHRPSTLSSAQWWTSPMFVLLKDSRPTPVPNTMNMIMYTTYSSRYHR